MEVVKISTNVPETPITATRMLHAEISLEVSAVLVIPDTKVMVLHALMRTNAVLEIITVIMPQNAQIPLAVSLVLVILDTEVMVSHVPKLTNVVKELTIAIPSMEHAPIHLAVSHVLVMMVSGVMA